MTDLYQDNQQRGGEDRQAIAAMDEADSNAPASFAGSSTLPTTESRDTLINSESLIRTTDGTTASPLADNVESVPAGNVVGANAEANEICASRTQPPPTTPDSETGTLYTQIKGMIAGRTRLPDSVSALVAFWAISTWFQEAFGIFPCLVITGPTHEAMVFLGVLNDLCWAPTLLAGFRRSDLKELTGYRTLLISEPNLDNRTAALLGNLTNRHFLLIEDSSYLSCAGSRAIYIGEDITIKRIQHSLYVDVTSPPHADPPILNQSRQETIDSLRNRLLKYRTRNLDKVHSLGFDPRGLSPEAHAIANALGSCVVDAPQLQSELVTFLKPQNQQQVADRSSSVEALVANAALTLCHQGKGEIYVKEIAAEVNRLLVARGETMQLTPERVGHLLKKVGLFTRRLSQAGNGLTLDQATRGRVHEVARAYLGEDSISYTENLHCQLCSSNECFREVM
jgi:hypothetical protein